MGPFVAEIRRRGIETFLYPLGRYRSGRKSVADMASLPLRSMYCALLLAHIIRRRNIRLVYINGPRCLIAGALAARLAGIPSVFHLHLTMTRKADIFVAARAAKYVDRIVACSKTAAAALLACHPELNGTLQVIYNPVRRSVVRAPCSLQTDPFEAHESNARDLVVGVVGRITPQKGHHVVLEAAAELARRGRNIRIVFVGTPGPPQPRGQLLFEFFEVVCNRRGHRGTNLLGRLSRRPQPFLCMLRRGRDSFHGQRRAADGGSRSNAIRPSGHRLKCWWDTGNRSRRSQRFSFSAQECAGAG